MGGSQSIDLSKTENSLVSEDWLSSAAPLPYSNSKYGHILPQKEALIYCGGSNYETACYKIKFGGTGWTTDASMKIGRKGGKSSIVMGGLMVTLGERVSPGKLMNMAS